MSDNGTGHSMCPWGERYEELRGDVRVNTAAIDRNTQMLDRQHETNKRTFTKLDELAAAQQIAKTEVIASIAELKHANTKATYKLLLAIVLLASGGGGALKLLGAF